MSRPSASIVRRTAARPASSGPFSRVAEDGADGPAFERPGRQREGGSGRLLHPEDREIEAGIEEHRSCVHGPRGRRLDPRIAHTRDHVRGRHHVSRVGHEPGSLQDLVARLSDHPNGAGRGGVDGGERLRLGGRVDGFGR
jgi:hypothetical protein